LTNTVSMFVAIAPYWNQTRSWLEINGLALFHVYLLVGLVFGSIAMVSYLVDTSPGGGFYTFTFLLYNSAVASIVCLVATTLSPSTLQVYPFS